MRTRYCPVLPILLLVFGVAFTACIKDEKPNIEVDVLSVAGRAPGILSVAMQSDYIDVYVALGTDTSDFGLDIAVSEGAVIEPDPATISDYSSPQVFCVTSEDRNWTRAYTVRLLFNDLPRRFDFENWRQPERMRYMVPFEYSASHDELLVWACGNEAYNFLTSKLDNYTAFPTQPTTDAYSGNYAAKLETKLTGQLDKPIAAGNLFIGQFDGSLRDPRESTMFGLPFMSKPLRIKGMYRYRSGGPTLASGMDDRCRIQAVLYRTDENVRHLNGLNIRTSPNIVARAEMESATTPGSGYVPFDLEFAYMAPVDSKVLAAGGYNLAVIFSSSVNGDVYDGASGSILYIDEVEIVCEL